MRQVGGSMQFPALAQCWPPLFCRHHYVRQEVLEQKFTKLLGRLHFDNEVLDCGREALHVSHAYKRREHEESHRPFYVSNGTIFRNALARCISTNSTGAWTPPSLIRCLRSGALSRTVVSVKSTGIRKPTSPTWTRASELLQLARNAQKLFERPGFERGNGGIKSRPLVCFPILLRVFLASPPHRRQPCFRGPSRFGRFALKCARISRQRRPPSGLTSTYVCYRDSMMTRRQCANKSHADVVGAVS